LIENKRLDQLHKMKITFLGTGTSQGVPIIACECEVCQSTDSRNKRLRASLLIEINGHNIVIDSGPDFRQQMLRANVKTLEAILFTHEHKDHIAGMDDIRAYNYVQQRPTDIYAEKRVQIALMQEFAYVFAEEKYPGVPEVNMHTIENKEFTISGIKVTPIRVMHLKLPILGFRFGNFAYITDANHIPKEEKVKLMNLKVLVINGLRKQKHLSHFTLDEALELINEVKPEKAYITHISHQLGSHTDVEKELPEGVFLSYDGFSLEV